MDKFTPTQRRMLQVLSDGRPHRREELHACLNDELGPVHNIRNHIIAMRTVLRQRGEDIICEKFERRTHYRHVRLLTASPLK